MFKNHIHVLCITDHRVLIFQCHLILDTQCVHINFFTVEECKSYLIVFMYEIIILLLLEFALIFNPLCMLINNLNVLYCTYCEQSLDFSQIILTLRQFWQHRMKLEGVIQWFRNLSAIILYMISVWISHINQSMCTFIIYFSLRDCCIQYTYECSDIKIQTCSNYFMLQFHIIIFNFVIV